LAKRENYNRVTIGMQNSIELLDSKLFKEINLMNSFFKNTLFVTLLLAICISVSYAQDDLLKWSPEDGVAIRQGLHLRWNGTQKIRMTDNEVGDVAWIWNDFRDGLSKIFIQARTSEGDYSFPENGLQVTESGNWRKPLIQASQDGWLVCWTEIANEEHMELYCTKVNNEGEILWGEEAGYIVVSDIEGMISHHHMFSDQNGGCIIIWTDRRRDHSGDIYAMHINSEGQFDENWPETGLAIAETRGSEVSMDADTDGSGGVIVYWPNMAGENQIICRAQRVTIQGELLWGNNGAVLCDLETNWVDLDLCSDGEGGAYICWEDERNLGESNRDIYCQKISFEGEMLWRDDGMPLCTADREQRTPKIILSDDGGAIVAWLDQRNGGMTSDIYSMKISDADQFEVVWGPEAGVAVIEHESEMTEFDLSVDGSGGAYFIWTRTEVDNEFQYSQVIHAQRITSEGERNWAEEGAPVGLAGVQSFRPTVDLYADNGCILAWGEYRDDQSHLRIQSLTVNGEAILEDNGESIVGGIPGNGLDPKLVAKDNGEFMVFWSDGRNIETGNMPYFQICHDLGEEVEFRLDDNGILALDAESAYCNLASVADDGADGALITWETIQEVPLTFVFAQHINGAGESIWDEAGVRCWEIDQVHNNSMICSDVAGGAFVAANIISDDMQFEIILQHLDENGARTLGDEGVRIDMDRDLILETIKSDGQGGVIVIWGSVDVGLVPRLHGSRFNADGESLWGDGGGITLVESEYRGNAQLYCHDLGYVVLWQQNLENDIYGQFIDADGNLLWEENGSQICNADQNQRFPKCAFNNDGLIWVIWQDSRDFQNNEGSNLYIQKISPELDFEGNLEIFFEENGQRVCQNVQDQYETRIISDAHNGVWLIWVNTDDVSEMDLYGTHLNPQGIPYEPWGEDGQPLCQAQQSQNIYDVALLSNDGLNGIVVVWRDYRCFDENENDGKYNIYSQKIDDGFYQGVERSSSELQPAVFEIRDVYPNPFNSSTLISYFLNKIATTRLSVLDLEGREVAVKNIGVQKPGFYQSVVDASSWSSGIYILRMEAGSEVRNVKIVVEK